MADGGRTTQTPKDITHPPAERAEVYERRRRAAEMRRAGCTWDEIAAECGYAGRGAAHNAVRALMVEARDLSYAEVELYRTESLERYTALLKAVWPMAMNGSKDHVESARRLIAQMDKLTGAEAPVKVEIGEGDIDRALREPEAELGRRSAAAQVQASRGQDAPG